MAPRLHLNLVVPLAYPLDGGVLPARSGEPDVKIASFIIGKEVGRFGF